MSEQLTAKQKLEAAVTKVGRAFDELVRTVEKNGAGITQEDLTKVFTFLGEVFAGSQNKAALSLSTAIAATGGFSLDTYQPQSQMTYSTGAPQMIVPSSQPLREGVVVGADGQSEGRMIGGPRRKKVDPLEAEDASEFMDEED